VTDLSKKSTSAYDFTTEGLNDKLPVMRKDSPAKIIPISSTGTSTGSTGGTNHGSTGFGKPLKIDIHGSGSSSKSSSAPSPMTMTSTTTNEMMVRNNLNVISGGGGMTISPNKRPLDAPNRYTNIIEI
jgi:hypothetical protein